MNSEKERVQNELIELEEKRAALDSFISGFSFAKLPLVSRMLLVKQSEVMAQYAQILFLRLNTWEDIKNG